TISINSIHAHILRDELSLCFLPPRRSSDLPLSVLVRSVCSGAVRVRNHVRAPVRGCRRRGWHARLLRAESAVCRADARVAQGSRSEEHTSELQSRENLVCRLLLEKKNYVWC